MDQVDSFIAAAIFKKFRVQSRESSSCYKISMAFLISAALVCALAGAMRITQDYIISKQRQIDGVVLSDEREGSPDLQFTYRSSIWFEFINNTNPFTLSVALAASPEVSLLESSQSVDLLDSSPFIRVGLFYTSRPHTIRGMGNYQIITGSGEVVLTSSGDKETSIWYDWNRKLYYYQQQNISQGFSEPFQVVATDGSVLEIVSYSNPPRWNGSLKDNRFRGSLELKYSNSTARLWMINELPLEDYLKGLGETRATDNPEYLKVMTIVGRSYAYSHKLDNYKHDNEHFHVDAYWDQVYRGYDNELRHPELVQAVEKTYSEVVMYDNEVAVTPYFARSNGRTRNWSEVWYQDPYPWIQSVRVPQERGLTQLGHGVGLSAVGAMLMAKDGMNYEDIIKYFYKDVEVAQAY